MYKCDIKIMASPSRTAYVMNMCKILSLDIEKDVFFDDRPNGGSAAYTSRKTWELPIEAGITHRCVLQDDLILCHDFSGALNRLVNIKPDAMFSLFCPQSKMVDYKNRYGVPQLVKNKKSSIWGQAIVCPVQHIEDIYPWGEAVAKENGGYVFHDDCLFGDYAEQHGIERYIPIPNIVQHLCPTSSLLGFNNKNKVSKVFDMDADKLEWEKYSESFVSIPNSVPFYRKEGLHD